MQTKLEGKIIGQVDSAPLFAVVVPTYNHADLLKEALESVIGQTFPRFEAVVIDNNSEDATVDVVSAFSDPRIRLLQIHNDGVISKSRNLGIRETRAPLVAFLDSDDVWYPQKLQRVYEAWEADAEAGLVCHDEVAVRNGLAVSTLSYGPFRPDMYRFMIASGSRLSPSATVVRREHLEQVGCFDEDPYLAGVEDYDLWLRLSGVCRFHFLHETLGHFRLHANSHTAISGTKLAHTLYLLDRHAMLSDRAGSPLPARLLGRRKAACYAGAVRAARSWWGKQGGLAYSWQAFRHGPTSWRTYAKVARSLAGRLLPIG